MDKYEACEPVIEEMPGWDGTTAGITNIEELPVNAKAYIERITELIGVKIAILSTGPDRDETIVIDNPFD